MSVVQDPSIEHPKKKQHLDDDNMTCMRREIADIKESLAEMASEAREERQSIINTLAEQVEMASEAREERQSIINTLAEQVEMASEAREDRQNIINTLDDLDIPRMTYEAWEQRDNIYYMLAELLAEIQQRK